MLYQGILIYCILLSPNFCRGTLDLSKTNYCDLCKEKKSHTICKYPTKDQPGACKPYDLTRDNLETLLDKHNVLRAQVARGEEKGQPQAANMCRLRYDMELEAIAARWALQCVDNHDKCRDSSRFNVGQNIAWLSYWDLETNVQMWYDEVKDFDASGVDSYQFESSTGHYTQLVWATTCRVGCAMTDRGSAPGIRFTLICNYGPGGNFLGRPIYQKGAPASACPNDTKADSKYVGLCATNDGDFDDMKLSPAALHAPATTTAMPLTVLLIFSMIFRKCWDILCAVTAT